VKNVPLAIVVDVASDEAIELTASFQLTRYFQPQISRSMVLAQQLLLEQRLMALCAFRLILLGN